MEKKSLALIVATLLLGTLCYHFFSFDYQDSQPIKLTNYNLGHMPKKNDTPKIKVKSHLNEAINAQISQFDDVITIPEVPSEAAQVKSFNDVVIMPVMTLEEAQESINLANLIEQETDLTTLQLLNGSDNNIYDQAWRLDMSVKNIYAIEKDKVINLQGVNGQIFDVRIEKSEQVDWKENTIDKDGNTVILKKGIETYILGHLAGEEEGHNFTMTLVEDHQTGELSLFGKIYTPFGQYVIRNHQLGDKFYIMNYTEEFTSTSSYE